MTELHLDWTADEVEWWREVIWDAEFGPKIGAALGALVARDRTRRGA